MLNLQTVVEELGSKCNGKVWVIVTSQEDIDSVTHVKGNDFSKIQGRFNTRLSLSSASVDEVIKRRILAKTDAASDLLQLMYRQHQAAMRNLFTFAQGTVSDLKGYTSEGEFVEAYPFVPYQFKLLQDVLVQVRKHGSSGKHLSGGERSMLSAFQEAAQKFKEKDETHFVPFYAFYDTVHTFLDGAVRRVIDRADRAAIAAGQALLMIDLGKAAFIVEDCSGGAGCLAGAAALAVLLIDVNLLFGYIGVVPGRHFAIQIAKQVVHLGCLAKANHHRVNIRLGEDKVQRLLIVFGETAAAKGLHGENTLACLMISSPNSVGFTGWVLRSNIVTSSSDSNFWINEESVDCVMPQDSAARAKWRYLSTATIYSIC